LVLRRAVGTTLMDEALTDAEVSAAVSGAEQLVDWVPRADSRLMLVTALTRAGRLDEAVAVAEQAEAENAGEPRLATVLAGKAWALQLQGDVFGAQAAYRAALAARDDAQSELMLFDTRLFDRVREKLNVPEADAAAPPGTE
jgi:tetratricopeptide (TPR) repeat protein